MVVAATSELMRSTGLQETEQDFAGRFSFFRDDSRGHLDGDRRRRQRPGVPGQRHDTPAGVFLGNARIPGKPFRQLGADHSVDGDPELRKSAHLLQRGDVVQLQVTGQGPGHRSGAGDAGSGEPWPFPRAQSTVRLRRGHPLRSRSPVPRPVPAPAAPGGCPIQYPTPEPVPSPRLSAPPG